MKTSNLLKIAVSLFFFTFCNYAISQTTTPNDKKETDVKTGTQVTAGDTTKTGVKATGTTAKVTDKKEVKSDEPKTRGVNSGEPVPGAEIYLEQEPDEKK